MIVYGKNKLTGSWPKRAPRMLLAAVVMISMTEYSDKKLFAYATSNLAFVANCPLSSLTSSPSQVPSPFCVIGGKKEGDNSIIPWGQRPGLSQPSLYHPLSRATARIKTKTTLQSTQRYEDLYAAIHRKEHEMRQVNKQHSSLSDPVRMAMGYIHEGKNPPPMRLAKALRRVYDDPDNIANPNAKPPSEEKLKREEKLLEHGLADATMRRGSFIADIKRKSLSRPGETFARFDDASMVAEAMVGLGADVVFINVDYSGYGGDISELRSAVKAVRKVNDKAAVVMKDIVVDEIQLGLAKDAGVDGVVLIASVLGPALENFLNLATIIGLETIVECHTRNEVTAALDALAQNIMVSNYDRIAQRYHPEQAVKLAGMFPGSGGPIVTIAGGDVHDVEQMKKLLAVGYDGVVVGKAIMGSTRAPEFIKAVRDRTLLPAEFSQWGLDDVEFDMNGNIMQGPKKNIPGPDDKDAFQ